MAELWFVVSPQNPFKEKKTLLKDHNRLDMVRLAIKNYTKMRASDVEFALPTPSYTVDTLAALKLRYPQHHFALIMGEDNLAGFHKWKSADYILQNYHLIVYPRKYEEISENQCAPYLVHENISLIKAPVIELSSTEIRRMIKENKNVRPMLPPEVFEYLDGSSFYH